MYTYIYIYVPLPSIPAEEGREAMPFDLELDGRRMDLSSSEGFCNALWAVGNLKPGSGHLSAPVCSTFVIVSLVHICICLFVMVAARTQTVVFVGDGTQYRWPIIGSCIAIHHAASTKSEITCF